MVNCQCTLTLLTLRWRILVTEPWFSQMSMTDASTTQDNFILPAPPVGRLPIFQDRLVRMKLVRDHNIPFISTSGKNILVNMMFNISIANHATRQIQSRLGSRVCLFIAADFLSICRRFKNKSTTKKTQKKHTNNKTTHQQQNNTTTTKQNKQKHQQRYVVCGI